MTNRSLKSDVNDLDTLAEIVASGAVSSGEISETEVIDRLTKDARNWRQGRLPGIAAPRKSDNRSLSPFPENNANSELPSVCPFSNNNANIVTFLLIAFAGISFCLFFTFSSRVTNLSGIYRAFSLLYNNILPSPIIFIFILLAAPFITETIFRKILFGTFRQQAGFALSAVLSSFISGVLFAVFCDNIPGIPVQFLYAFCGGFFCAFVYEHTKNLWASIIFHFFANAADVFAVNLGPLAQNIEMVIMALAGVAAVFTFAALTFRLDGSLKSTPV
ncbi:MAG: CPBP family intramembrane metalloprotease [Ruminococcus sp.]|jgi:membrane protease YdiL (CAAX protease family)|nr:CPBP family intramembrane metalloprotease [Ruminococcus sp.]